MRKLTLTLLTLAASTAFALNPASWHQSERASQVVSELQPFVVAEQKNSVVTEVFMKLKNTGNETHALIAATSPDAEYVQLHTTAFVNGKMQMHPVASIVLHPHTNMLLHNGGLHIMLIDTDKKVTKGKRIPLTLIFDDGSWTVLHVKVK